MAPNNQHAAPAPAAAPTSTSSAVKRAPQLEGTTSISSPLNLGLFSSAPLPLVSPPLTKPPFSKDDIIAAIPKECFERNMLTSFGHLAQDLLIVAALGYAASHIQYAPRAAAYLLWPLYIYAQGCVMTGLWVLAHECGHQAFSDSKFVNDSVGWVVHSALLVPYHSWRITHKNHHSNTCSVERDEVFASPARSSFAAEMMQDTPLAHVWGIVVMLLFGWCVLRQSPPHARRKNPSPPPAALPPPPLARSPHLHSLLLPKGLPT